jgi:16S rRNA processing protein RimM
MGEVLGAYGVQGWLRIRTFTASPASLLDYRAWWLGTKAGWRELAVLEGRRHAEGVVVRLEGMQEREDAARWRGADVAVPRAALPALGPDEAYAGDLIGLTVVNRQGATLGCVVGHIDTAAHPVLRVAADAPASGERLIPWVPAYVDAVDLRGKRVVVDWPVDY